MKPAPPVTMKRISPRALNETVRTIYETGRVQTPMVPQLERATHARLALGHTAKRVAILQSCYIPWKGYFDIIGSVDVFVIYDDVQYPLRTHWHNRNLIKTQHGSKWLTVPVSKAGASLQKIRRRTASSSLCG